MGESSRKYHNNMGACANNSHVSTSDRKIFGRELFEICRSTETERKIWKSERSGSHILRLIFPSPASGKQMMAVLIYLQNEDQKWGMLRLFITGAESPEHGFSFTHDRHLEDIDSPKNIFNGCEYYISLDEKRYYIVITPSGYQFGYRDPFDCGWIPSIIAMEDPDSSEDRVLNRFRELQETYGTGDQLCDYLEEVGYLI